MKKFTKNKNRFRLLVIIAMAAVVVSGCAKYLDQQPNSTLTREQFFQTEADANAANVGVYNALQGCVSLFLNWGEYRGDLVSPTTLNTTNYPYYEFFSPDATTTNSSASDWSLVYKMIGRANVVVESVPGIVQLDRNFTQEKSNAIVGQARYLRALGYFYLVRAFGDVPLALSAPSSDDVNYRLPKSPADSVLNQIEADLAFAEQYVPKQYSSNQDTKGFVTVGAVNALQTDVYMWRAKYQQAIDASAKVLSNNLYALVSGNTWFSMFSQKNATESIFEVQFNYSLQQTNSLEGNSSGNNFYVNPVLLNYYVTEQDAVRGNLGTYVTNGSTTFWKYIGLSYVPLSASQATLINRTTNDPNFIIYRLADVMLLRAEALAHQGFSQKTEAISIINTIRSRAYLVPYYSVDGSASTSLLEGFILKERAMELAMEGKRWFDLVRVATNDKNPDLLINMILQGRTVGERALIRSRIIDPRSWYLPFLSTELAKNPYLIQNPYYL